MIKREVNCVYDQHLPERRKSTETDNGARNTADIRIEYYFPKSVRLRLKTPVVVWIQTALCLKVTNSITIWADVLLGR